MRIRWTHTVLLVVPAFLAGCGGGGPRTAAPRDANLITRADIEASEAVSAYQIIQQLRPRWLVRNRGPVTFQDSGADFPRVVVDDMPPRELGYLSEIRRESIQEIRFLEARDATFQYGTGYTAGVIKVTLKR